MIDFSRNSALQVNEEQTGFQANNRIQTQLSECREKVNKIVWTAFIISVVWLLVWYSVGLGFSPTIKRVGEKSFDVN